VITRSQAAIGIMPTRYRVAGARTLIGTDARSGGSGWLVGTSRSRIGSSRPAITTLSIGHRDSPDRRSRPRRKLNVCPDRPPGHADRPSGHADRPSGHADRPSGHADRLSARADGAPGSTDHPPGHPGERTACPDRRARRTDPRSARRDRRSPVFRFSSCLERVEPKGARPPTCSAERASASSARASCRPRSSSAL
jgi:hypothetical protein